jgi:Tol biopolymer transport system component
LEENCDIYVVNAEGGKVRRLTTESSADGEPSWSSDGQWVYFSSEQANGEPTLRKVPAKGGPTSQVTIESRSRAFESADSRFVYYTKALPPFLRSLCRIPVGGGEETRVVEQLPIGYLAVVNSGVYFVNGDTKPKPTIQFFNFVTRQITPIASFEKPPESFTISPDGRWMLYAQVDHSNRDIILVENFQ